MITIGVVDNSAAFCQKVRDFFNHQEGFEVVGVGYTGLDALDIVDKYHPDVLILDVIIPKMDGFSVIEILHSKPEAHNTKVIMLTAFGPEQMAGTELGAVYYARKPLNLETLATRIRQMHCSENTPALLVEPVESDLELDIVNCLFCVGMPANLKGYRYLVDAIHMVVHDAALIGAVTKGIYLPIAEKYDTTPSSVERAMRHAIGVAWRRVDVEVFKRLFGLLTDRGRPSNSHFIALVAGKARQNICN